MLNFIDNFLNKTTMYRVVLYVLIFFFVSVVLLSALKFLPYSPLSLAISLFIIVFLSYIFNTVFSYLYNAPTNNESVYITAFILFFLITPVLDNAYWKFLPIAFLASLFATASKYILAIKKKHLFNPAAIALVLLALTINEPGSWWIGASIMLPFIILGGFLITRKIRRADLVLSFIISSLAITLMLAALKNPSSSDILNSLLLALKNSSLFFFAFIMLTEPLTSPTTKWLRIAFGILVGFLFAPGLHIGSYYFTPELALVIGNIFAYLVSPKEKLFLKLKQRIAISADIFEFIFQKDKNFSFQAGQYMEWTLKHDKPDTRGNRRYFTLASSPTEDEIRLGVKFYPKENKQSSFKSRLLELPIGAEIVAAQKSGDFVLPKNKDQGLVFIAGGIGITPFRSMVQYLLDKKEKREITLFYSNKKISDIAYKDIFDRAEEQLGLKTVYAVTEVSDAPRPEYMHSGFIDAQIIKKEVPDYLNKIFYISGPHSMVDAFENTLKSMKVLRKNIKIDFFPGFA